MWNVSRRIASARLDSELGSENPPVESFETTPPPNAPARTTATMDETSTHHRRLTANRPTRSSIARPLSSRR